MKRIGAMLALACALLVAGCVTPTSKNPIGMTTGLHRDLSLVGTWKDDFPWRDEGDTITVAPVGTDNSMTAFQVGLPEKKDGAGSFQLYEFTVARVGEHHFVNARKLPSRSEHTDQPDDWMPLYYTTTHDGRSLKLYYLSQDKIVKAIESGALKGRVEKHQRKNDDGTVEDAIDAITITAEPAELDAFMAKPEAADLFQLYKRYWRVD
jgi:hypothetical protein